jgi:hypothetical protein
MLHLQVTKEEVRRGQPVLLGMQEPRSGVQLQTANVVEQWRFAPPPEGHHQDDHQAQEAFREDVANSAAGRRHPARTLALSAHLGDLLGLD